jgi:ubiquinone/menaquinone biosynthesis C-methylase UbiE
MNAEKRDFDQEAVLWDENPARVKMADDLFAAMEKQVAFDSSMTVLDFGCGTGLLTLRIAPGVGSITGADSSRGMLEVLQAKSDRLSLRNVRTLFLDSGDTNLLTGRYDIIVIGMALHHIEAIHPLLKRFHECLAEGGALCIADLDPEGGLFHSNNAGVYHFGFDREELRRAMGDAGFENIADSTAAEVTRPAADGQLRRFTLFLMSGWKGSL